MTRAPSGSARCVRQVVIGVGNRFRRDDGLGPAALARMAGFAPDGCELVCLHGEASALLEAWDRRDVAIVVDALRSGAAPGVIERAVVGDGSRFVPATVSSTHALGLGEAVELARVLGRLPGRLVVYGVVGADFGQGEGLSPEVEAALDDLVDQVLVELTLEARLSRCSDTPGSAELR